VRRLSLIARIVLPISALVAAEGVIAVSASASGLPATGASGYDISWPQCGGSYPAGGSFGIVGITNGRPWGANPCWTSQYTWASQYPATPQLYMNTANPAPTSSYYWPTSGSRDPALCQNAGSTTDPGCAYDYGWHAAANALATASSQIVGATQDVWWLDVETGNSWNGDGSSNAADLQGSIDFLRSQGVTTIGVYSTGYQWNAITGGYTMSTAASYAAAWSGEFTSPNGIASSPSWLAGASSGSSAPSYCSSSFSGTSTWLVQFPSGSYDGDYWCGNSPPPPPTPSYAINASPQAVTVGSGVTATVTITLTASGGWQGSVSLAAAASRYVTTSISPSSVGVPGQATLGLSSTVPGSYTVTVTATPAASSSTSTVHSTTVTFTVRRHRG